MLRSEDPKSAIFCIEEKSDLGRERQRKRDRYESGMAIEEMQARKRWRFGNGGGEGKIDDDEDDGEAEESPGVEKEEKPQLLTWQSSRIFRVSRGAGGKDRHSKVITAKGLRDRRVRLSVSTAIQFYDLQDRLGYDQPSKAVEWLIKAAAHAIAELPSLDVAFPTSPKQANDEKPFEPDAETEPTAYLQQQQLLSLTKSAGSSTSETSKGSVLSISRSEIRVKARERARERTAKERGKEKESNIHQQQNPNTQGSFTDLLTGCNGNTSASTIPTTATENTGSSFIHKQFRHFPSSMDYFGSAAIPGPGRSQLASSSGFSSQAHLENSSPSTLPLNITAATAGDHPELHQFSFFQDHLMPLAVAGNTANGHNLNFSISSSLAGFNRGTLQSNSSSLLPHLQRFPTPVIEPPPNLPFLIGTGASTTAADNQFLCAFDGRLQLCYGDGCRHSDFKGKGKS